MKRKWIKNAILSMGEMVKIKMPDGTVHKDIYVDRYAEEWRSLLNHECRDNKSADR